MNLKKKGKVIFMEKKIFKLEIYLYPAENSCTTCKQPKRFSISKKSLNKEAFEIIFAEKFMERSSKYLAFFDPKWTEKTISCCF